MNYILSATERVGKPEEIRAKGGIPAVVYGAGSENKSLVILAKDFDKLYEKIGESTLIDLKVGDKDMGKVLIQEVQSDPIKGRVIHLDLRRVDMNKPLTVNVELNFIGESPAVKDLGGTLVRNVNVLEVKCLPKDLVDKIDVDLGILKTFDDVLRVKGIVLPAGIEVLSPNAEDVVATAAPALTEEQIKAMEEAAKSADITKIEVEAKGKEEVEGEEGAADEKKPEGAKKE